MELRWCIVFLAMGVVLSAQESQLDQFRNEVKPLLIASCLKCHGGEAAKGGFDLATREGLLLGGNSGPAVDLASPEQSLLHLLVTHEKRPPMPKGADRLSEGEIASLLTWIRNGVPYEGALTATKTPKRLVTEEDKNWWSFRKLSRPEIPSGQHPIDALVQRQQRAKGLSAAPTADDRTLLRRLHFNLTGLPPTSQDLTHFRSAPAPERVQRTAAALMSSSHFGERWARHWLDVARYADSNGYEFDEERPHAWPYRDFVIKAMNEDMPFDQFLAWQIAGDELAPEDRYARAATGFLAAGPVNGNENNEGTRYTELDDVLSTTASAALGLTLGCARCHDHKYDAIPTADYYSMLAAFTSTHRVETYFAPSDVVEQHEAQKRGHSDRVLHAEVEYAAWLEKTRSRAAEREVQNQGQDDPWNYTFEEPPANWREPSFDVSTWKQGLGGFGTKGTPGAVIGTTWSTATVWMRKEVVFDGDPSDLAVVAHHDEDVVVYLNDAMLAEARGFKTDYVELHVTDFGRDALKVGKNTLAVFCRQTVGGQFVDVRLVKRSRLLASTARELALEGRQGDPDALFTAEERRERDERSQALAKLKRRRPQAIAKVMHLTDRGRKPVESFRLRRGNPEDKEAPTDLGFITVLCKDERPAAAWVAGEPASRTSTNRRRALASWLTDVDHGAGALAARVIVNRIWLHHFGKGLVATPNDFGVQGAKPTHPELLEWLASELVSKGWRLKPLHELIVTSATWQAGHALSEEARLADLEGTELSHRRLRRLDAEAIRDSILAVSGCLNRQVAGPSVMPHMHRDAIATGSTLKWAVDVVDGPATWRRSLYIFTRRSVRFPLLESFDCPDAQASAGERPRTVTPLQSLSLLNDTFVRDQSRHFAARIVREAGASDAARIRHAWLLALSREPTPTEHVAAEAFLRARISETQDANTALADLAHVLFNLNEFLHID